MTGQPSLVTSTAVKDASRSKGVPVTTPVSLSSLDRHIEFSLKKLSILGLSHETGSLGKGSGGITVVDTRSRKILTGLAAPNEKSLLPWIKNHPTYKLYVPSTKGGH